MSLLSIYHKVSNVSRQKKESFYTLFYLVMFVLFRIFDIVKPFPVSYYDKNFKNSFGIIMDDVCAGLYVVGMLVLYMIFV